MRRRRASWPPLLACGVFLAMVGCVGSSRTARFYTLAPLESRDAPASSGTNSTLALGPVEIPEYLEREQIVTRTGANELVLADFDRWGGSLEREISRALVATLADRLASRNIRVAAWRSVTPPPVTSGYRAAVSISRFDGVLGQSVVLNGRWELIAERGTKADSLAVREATVTEKIDGESYEALVAAMQRALVRFGQEMADAIAAATQIANGR
jgi:uncharacterized protein